MAYRLQYPERARLNHNNGTTWETVVFNPYDTQPATTSNEGASVGHITMESL